MRGATFILAVFSLAIVGCAEDARRPASMNGGHRETSLLTGPSTPNASANATFTFSSDDVLATFECALDMGVYAPCTSPTTYTGLADGSHVFYVRDVIAGVPDPSEESYHWDIDTTAPDTSIDSGPMALTTATTADFQLSSTESPVTYECSLDGQPYFMCSDTVQLTGLADGAHTLLARSIDFLGHVDLTSASYNWTVDATGPNTSIVTSPSVFSNSSDATFTFSASEGSVTYQCSLDSAPFTSCAASQTFPSLSDGPHQLQVQALDALFNVDPTPASFSWSIDTVEPDTAFGFTPNLLSNSSAASFAFTSPDVGTFECRLDLGAYAPCTSPRSLSSLAEGSHTFDVRAIDLSGNVDSSPASYTWNVDTIRPNTSFGSTPPTSTNSSNATFTLLSTETPATFECSLDGDAFASCTTPVNLSGLSDGGHNFRAVSQDDTGNQDASPVSYNWTIDSTEPNTVIDSGPPALATSGTAAFQFSSLDSPVTFECSMDGAPFAACVYNETFLGLADGIHQLLVRAVDAASNIDSSPAVYDWTIDTTAPDTTLTVTPSALTSNASATFEFNTIDSGATFQCRLDAGAWSSCNSPQLYSLLADGAHTFDVRAVDLAGNADASPATFSWTVDTTPPDTFILSGPPSSTNASTAVFDFNASEPSVTYECQIDFDAFSACPDPQTYLALADGSHSLRVRAIDALGNVDASEAVWNWTIDATAPETTVASGPPSLTNNPMAAFTFESDDLTATFQCQLDGGALAPCTAAPTFGPLADGMHTLSVNAIDAASNVDPSPELYTWTIDTTPPNTAIDSSPSSPTSNNTADFSFSSPDGATSFECSFDGGPYSFCVSPTQLTNVLEGAHTYAVRAIDNVGNADASPASAAWTVDLTEPDTNILSSPTLTTASVNATFTFSSSDLGATFSCALDAGSFLPCTSPQNYVGLSEGQHTFYVKAKDGVGLEDSSPAQVSWTIDITAPDTLFMSTPANPSNSPVGNFDFDSNESTVSYECRLDSAPGFTPCNDPEAFSGLTHGPHGLEVRAIDGVGNVDASPASYFWDVDLIAPDTTMISTPLALDPSPSATFDFSGSEMGLTFQCRLDGAAFASCVAPLNYPSVADGSHTFDVRSVDAAGNADPTPSTFTWTVDTTNPNTFVDSGPAAVTSATGATFTFHSDEVSATFECNLDAGGFSSCVTGQSYSGLAAGAHTFSVRAIDALLHVDSTPATYNWTIDLTPPDTSFVGTPTNPSNLSSPSFGLASTEPGGTFECSVDGGAFATCTATPTFGPLSDGAHTLAARAIDPGGNTDLTPVSFSWIIDTTSPNTTAAIGPYTTTTSASVVLGADEAPVTFECALDGGAFIGCANPANFTGLLDGSHTILVRATDSLGNVDATPASDTWIQDTVPPDTILDPTGPSGTQLVNTADFNFSSLDSPVTFNCDLDGGGFAPCTSPQSYTGLALGAHSFRVQAVDVAGNVDSDLTTSTRNWVIGSGVDTDGDGLSDLIETTVTVTDPNDDDSDNDGILDGNEDMNGDGVLDVGETNPRVADTDGDGLQDGTEMGLTTPQGSGSLTGPGTFRSDLDPTTTTDPRLTDSDGGGVLDGIEDANHNGRQDAGEPDPTIASDDYDRDRDGLDDASELLAGTDPDDGDSDDDGVYDGIDGVTDNDGDGLIDALDPDSDNDGILDGTEHGITAATAPADTDRTSPNFKPDLSPLTQTNPKLVDTDGDGLSDGQEDTNHNGRVDADESDPLLVDTDRDGLNDFLERRGQNPTNPGRADTDGDGLADGVEDANHNGRVDAGETNPNRADTDGDGRPDGLEIAEGTDPLNVIDGLDVSGGGCTKSDTRRRSADLGWGLALFLLFFRKRRREEKAPRWMPFVVACFALFVFGSSELRAESASTSVDLHRLKLGAGESDVFGVLGVPTTTWRKFRGAANFGYASQLLSFTSANGQAVFRPIESHKSIDVTAAYGATDRSEVSLSISAIAQSTQIPPALAAVYPNGIATSGLGDARLALKYRLSELTSPLRFGFSMGVALPTGDSASYLGSGSFTFQPKLLTEYLFRNGVRLVGNVGFDLRPDRQILNLTVGSEIVAGVGVAIPIRRLGRGTRVLVDTVAAYGLSGSSMPAEMRLGMSFRVRPTIGVQVAYGRGLTSGYGTPEWRAFAGISFGESTSPITDGYELRPPPKKAAPSVTPAEQSPPSASDTNP